MTDTTTTVPNGIATLAQKQPVDGFNPADGPWRVHGVAITENAVTVGKSETRRLWPQETLEDAAERGLLRGRPIVKNFHDREGQAPADDVIGEITAVGYADGIGLVYEGEISDEAIAEKVDAGYLDVSPVPLIGSERTDDTREAQRVERIERFRDLAVVAEGAVPGNQIEMGPNPGVAALNEALSQHFDTKDDGDVAGVEALQREEARTPTYSGTEDAEWDTPTLDAYLTGYDSLPDPDDVQSVNDLSEGDRSFIAAKSLLGTPAAESLREVRFFPVVNPATDALNRRALGAVRSGRGEQADIPADALASAQAMAGELLNDEFDAEIDVEAASGGDDGPHDQATAGGEGQSTPAAQEAMQATWRHTMSEDLTDEERELLAAAGQIDNPRVVSAGEWERLSQHEEVIDEYESLADPVLVEKTRHEQLETRIEKVEGLMADALQERTGLADQTVDAMPFEAMAAEFETEDGDIDFEALTQSPESSGGPTPDDGEDTPSLDALSTTVEASDVDEAIEELQQRHAMYSERGWGYAEEVAEDLEALGVEV